jgi:hypothetical protein
VIDRIEEYRRDWVSGPAPKKRKGKPFRVSRPLKIGAVFVLSLSVAVAGALASTQHLWRPQVERFLQNEVCKTKTQLEMSAQLRLLRQHYLSNGSLPPHPVRYLEPYLKDNKAYPRGCDFWGHPYRIEQYWDYFGVRSAGPNGCMDDHDDLLMVVKYKDLSDR